MWTARWLATVLLASRTFATVPTAAPTPLPSPLPTPAPSIPTYAPSPLPTAAPSGTFKPTNSFNPTVSPTVSPTLGPTLTLNPSLSPTPTPTPKPTDVTYKDFSGLSAGSANQELVQAIVFALLLALAGIGMGVANYHHDQVRLKKKNAKIAEDEEKREELRESLKEGGCSEEDVEAEVLKQMPLRDFDEEELDEQADEPNPLFQIAMLVWMLLYPFRVAVFAICCAVQRQKLKAAADLDEDEADDDTLIDGFPIDCGTKDRKFLSMSKAKSVTVGRHPHKEFVQDGNTYIEPFMLFEEMGQHNMSEWPFPETKRTLGLLKDPGFIDKYGIGMALYFKFLKAMVNVFLVASLIAIFPITYYYTGSSVPLSTRTAAMQAGSLNDLMFLTSSGSLLGQSFVCGSGFTGQRVSLECSSGTIQQVEAYFGEPEGSCSCPPKQQLIPSTGACPASPDTSRYEHGECTTVLDDDDDDSSAAPCFKGQMWTGEGCCAYGVDANHRWPDFSDLAMLPKPGCDSGSAQFIAQAACLGQTNCTIDVTLNRTFTWLETPRAPCADGTLLNRDCFASLSGPGANFSDCPKSQADYRFVVRGVCDESKFQFRPNGQFHSRADWALACSWCDAITTFILFCAVLWMAEKEIADVNIADMHYCSVDDYTLRVLHLPPPTKGMSPDLEKLKDAIRAHFNSHMAVLPPVIRDRTCRVVDVNLGMNNQETIKNMKKRGTLARMLDLATDKLQLMTEFGTGTEKELQKQKDLVSTVKVNFLAVCELVKYKKHRLEAKTAFVTFDSEEGYERVRKAYSKRYGLFGPPKAHYFRGKHLFQVTTAERPSDYVWEHLSTPWAVRTTKVLVSNLLALALLVVGFAIIILAEDDKNKANLQAGTTDCTPYTFGWSGNPEWNFRFTNGTNLVYDRDDVVHNQFPDKYNVTYPITGLLGCYCESVSEKADETVARAVEFFNFNTGKLEEWCGPYFDNIQSAFLSGQAAVLVILVVNEALKSCFATLVAFEGHETRTQEILSLALKLFGAMLINTALLTVLITGNLNIFFGGVVNPATQTLSDLALLAGNIDDFTPDWYRNVGAAIGSTLFLNAFALNATSFVAAAQMWLFRCLDRGCTLDHSLTKQKLQVQLETLYTGPEVKLEERYAALLVCFTACVVYSGGMPILWLVGYISFLIALLADKWAFLRVYRLPPKIGPTLARVCTDQLPVPLLIHTILSMWSFSAPTLFDYTPLTVVEGNVSATDYGARYNGTRTSPHGHMTDFLAGDEYTKFSLSSQLTRILTHRNCVPQNIMLCIWIIWFLTTKVLELDELYAWIHKLCAKKEQDLAVDLEGPQEGDAPSLGGGELSSKTAPLLGPGAKQSSLSDDTPQVSLDGDDGEGVAGGGEGGGEADKAAKRDAPPVVEGGAPGEPQDDASAGAGAGGGSAATAATAAAAAGGGGGGGGEDLLNLRPEGGFSKRSESMKLKLGVSDEAKPDHTHEYLDNRAQQLSVQQSFMEHEIEAHHQETQNMSGGGIDAAKAEVEKLHSGGGGGSLRRKSKKKKKPKAKKGKKELAAGPAVVEEEEEEQDEENKAAMELEKQRLFRTDWMKLLEFVQANRGRRLIEGNADYFWAIPTEELKKHVYQKVLHVNIREEFQRELDFRHEFPEFAEKVTRKLQGLVSYDFNCNPDYNEAFALDSKCLRAYQRGKIQVSGQEYEIAHRGFFKRVVRLCTGTTSNLDVVFPEINQDMNPAAERHTTAIGIDPTKVAGPRFVLNLRVPPPPANLHAHADHHHVPITDLEDPNYDEWEENWQYIKITVRDVFEYRVRLPKGLQFKKVPEIQIEIPAVEMTLSPVRTVMIGEDRVIASAKDQERNAGQQELREKQLANTANLFSAKTMVGVTDNKQAESLDRKAAKTAKEESRRQKREEQQKEKNDAAKKIQAAWMGKSARLAVTRMTSWQNRLLQFLEGFAMTGFAIALVVLDLTLSLGFAAEYPGPQQGIAYFATVFFTLELSVRFGCYAFLSRSKGLDCGDLDFFTNDYLRAIDLATVVVDLISTAILLFAASSSGGQLSNYLRSSKGARVVRVAKLVKVFRVARLSKATKFSDREAMYKLTGQEPISMQRYHISAPREVEKGNRLEVTIPHLGKVQIQFPMFSKEEQPIQFHLPVCCKHHMGQIAPNCFLVKPSAAEALEGQGQYSGTGSVSIGQHGWCQLWSPKDDEGLLDPPHKGGLLHSLLHKTKYTIDEETGEKHKEEGFERRERLYKDFYDDYTKHRVWYQVMAFAPKPVVKDFHDLSLFQHELDHVKDDAVVMTLPPGELKGERIECTIPTDRGTLHLQNHMIHVPGVGDVMTTLLATDEVTVPGLHDHPMRALGVLPWSANAAEKKQLVPNVIGEVIFDFPAIMLPRVAEIINMKFSKQAAAMLGDNEGQAMELGNHHDKKRESAGRYLERECFTHAFQIMPGEFVTMMRAAQKKIKQEKAQQEKELNKKKRKERRKTKMEEKEHKKEERKKRKEERKKQREDRKAIVLKARLAKEKGSAAQASPSEEASNNTAEEEPPANASPAAAKEEEEIEAGGGGGGEGGSGSCCSGKSVKGQVKTTVAEEDDEENGPSTEMVERAKEPLVGTGEEGGQGDASGNKDREEEEAGAGGGGGGGPATGEADVDLDLDDSDVELDSDDDDEGSDEDDEAPPRAPFKVDGGAPSDTVTDAAAEEEKSAGVGGEEAGGDEDEEEEGEEEDGADDEQDGLENPEEAAAAKNAKEEERRKRSSTAAEARQSILEEAQEEAHRNMEGVDLDQLAFEAQEHQKINLPRVGRFDVQWPEDQVEPFNVSFPAIKPGKQLREEVLSLIEVPSDNQAAVSPLARRYQFGWVLVHMQEETPSGAKVFMRLPAYVSHKQRALGTLDPDDFASPYSNRLSARSVATAGGAGDAGPPKTQEEAMDRAAKAEARVKELEAKISQLERNAEPHGGSLARPAPLAAMPSMDDTPEPAPAAAAAAPAAAPAASGGGSEEDAEAVGEQEKEYEEQGTAV